MDDKFNVDATVEKPAKEATGRVVKGLVKGFIKDKLGSTGKVLVDPVGNLRGGADGAMKGSTSSTAKKSLKAALGGLVIMGIVLGVMVFGWLFWAFIKVFLFFGFVFGAFLFLAGISFALFGTITSVVVAMFRSDCLSGIQGIRVCVAGNPTPPRDLNRRPSFDYAQEPRGRRRQLPTSPRN